MRITQRTPRPTAPPTSSLPARAGRWVWGRDTKPRTWPPGVASTRMLPSGPSPLHWSDTRSSAFESPPRRSPAVRARPSAAVAVGSVPCRTRASSTSSVVTAARPRTVPSALSVRARRSATACLVHGAQHLGSADQTREAAALAAVRTEEDERRHTGHAEAAAERARALGLGGDGDLDHHEVGCRAHDRGGPGRGAPHPLEPGAGAWQHAKPSGQRRQREVGRTEPEPEHEEEGEAERHRLLRADEEEERQHRRADAGRGDDAHGEAHEEGAQVALADAAETLHDRRGKAQLIEAEVAPREAHEHERDRGQDGGSLERRAEEGAGPRRG